MNTAVTGIRGLADTLGRYRWVSLVIATAFLNLGNLMMDEASKGHALSFALFFSPMLIIALGMLAFAFLFYVQALKQLPLAVAYPFLVGTTIVIVTVREIFWLDHLVSSTNMLGSGLVLIGVLLVTTSATKRT